MRTNFIRMCIALMAIAFCSIAEAHPGHGNGAMAGMVHPFLGMDHLLAMIAVGMWAFQQGGNVRWLVPASFVSLMAVGAGLGMGGFALPMVESGIATSVLLLGLLIAFAVKLSPASGACLVGMFAICHGYAHGTEMPQLASPWLYACGFILSTAVLHGLGLLGGSLLKRGSWLRTAGALVAASGVLMMATS